MPEIEENLDTALNDEDIIDESLYYRTFFGKSADYYEKIYKRLLDGESVIFNPYAFFFNVFWLAYRKMYVELIILVLGIGFLNNFILFVLGIYTYKATLFIGVLLAGCYGNVFYMKKAQRTVKRAKEMYLNTEAQLDNIEQEGGVSLVGPVVVAFTIFVLTIGIYAFTDYMKSLHF